MYNFKKQSNTGHIASRHPLSQDAGQIKQKKDCPVKYGTGGNPGVNPTLKLLLLLLGMSM